MAHGAVVNEIGEPAMAVGHSRAAGSGAAHESAQPFGRFLSNIATVMPPRRGAQGVPPEKCRNF
jgi:hypothetical protein